MTKDFLSEIERSVRMSSIRSKNTTPEIRFRRQLFRVGLRYGLHSINLPGHPDIVLRSKRIVIQIRGCFWHQHLCRDGHIPKTKRDYWAPKLARNVARDLANDAALRALGWHVIIVWECEIRSKIKLIGKSSEVIDEIQQIAASLSRLSQQKFHS